MKRNETADKMRLAIEKILRAHKLFDVFEEAEDFFDS